MDVPLLQTLFTDGRPPLSAPLVLSPVVVAEATAVDEVFALLRVGIVSPVRVVAFARALHLGHYENYEENEGKTRARAAKFTQVMMTWKGRRENSHN